MAEPRRNVMVGSSCAATGRFIGRPVVGNATFSPRSYQVSPVLARPSSIEAVMLVE
jgi:hypothetical protein